VGEDPEQLERDIEATRAKLGQDIDALEEKVNPKKVANRSVASAKEKVAEVKDKVVGKAAEAKDKAAEAREKMQNGGPGGNGTPGEKATGLADTVKEKAGPLVGTAREKAQPLVDKAAPVAQQVKEKAAIRAGLDPQTADTKQVATTLAGETWANLQDQTRRNPAVVGGVAFVLGFLLGR
jgi:cell division septum initiation protein DivIVA